MASYVNMDHAEWAQSNITTYKQSHKPTARQRRAATEHKGWFGAPETLNGFQRRAIDILGIVGGGIYNAPISWDTVVWSPRFVLVSWRFKGLGTWDFMELTRFVFLCHEARIRGYISPQTPQHLQIALHERVHEGDISRRHPNLDEAIAAWRAEFRADHPIAYREPAAQKSGEVA